MFFLPPKHSTIFLERLRLREARFSDVSDVFAFCSDPASSKYADWYPHNDKSETKAYISWLKKKALKTCDNSYTWVIEHKKDEKVIGTISIVDTDYSKKIATVGYTLAADYQHKGYATEALKGVIKYLFEDMSVERVQAKVMVENDASLRLLERVGMQREGLLRRGAYCKTACVDVYIYSMTANDYFLAGKKFQDRVNTYA